MISSVQCHHLRPGICLVGLMFHPRFSPGVDTILRRVDDIEMTDVSASDRNEQVGKFSSLNPMAQSFCPIFPLGADHPVHFDIDYE